MIRTTKNGIEVNGKGIQLMMELTNIMRCLYENDVVTKDGLEECVSLATMTTDELEEHYNKTRESMIERINDLIDMFEKVKEKRKSESLEEDAIDEIISYLHKKEKDNE